MTQNRVQSLPEASRKQRTKPNFENKIISFFYFKPNLLANTIRLKKRIDSRAFEFLSFCASQRKWEKRKASKIFFFYPLLE